MAESETGSIAASNRPSAVARPMAGPPGDGSSLKKLWARSAGDSLVGPVVQPSGPGSAVAWAPAGGSARPRRDAPPSEDAIARFSCPLTGNYNRYRQSQP